VPWVGVAGAFGEEVVGGGRCFFGLWAWLVSMGVAGLERETEQPSSVFENVRAFGGRIGGKGKAHACWLLLAFFFFFFLI
jgi:hypothetical protein